MDELEQKQWQEAFAAYGLDAATGRLFRGLAHNINGVAQAFSMQTELLQMLLTQAGGLLDQVEQAASLDEAREICRKLQTLLARRASLVVHLEKELTVIREIMQRCSGLVEAAAPNASGAPFSLRDAVETELEFMNGDGFFKHKVKKVVEFAADIPLLNGFQVEIHQILLVLLENAGQAMQATFVAGQTFPCLQISATVSGNRILLSLSDNGEGIAPELQARIFEPFFSTRTGRLGMGLWLARSLAGRLGGAIGCESAPGQTAFTLAIPHAGGGDVGC
ncbi:MAG: sensor histidine kinase [Desulfobulbaceae bacterium]|nr:sensor histidine kinase [Desulfobulbaceae bacterium]